jgi:hypothetical protein
MQPLNADEGPGPVAADALQVLELDRGGFALPVKADEQPDRIRP